MDITDLTYEKDGQLAIITLNRPEARNAYSEEMVESLVTAFDEAEADAEVRCVVLTGAGSAFCAGGDLKRMRAQSGMFEGGPEQLRKKYLTGIHQIPRRLACFEKPVVAAVNGPAMGAGLDLACMCDVRVAARRARFGSSFVKVGLMSGDGGAYLLTRIVGFPRALEMMLTGRTVNIDEAERMGLVNEVVDDDNLLEAARARARDIAANAPIAVRLTKSAVYHSLHGDLDAALNLAATYQGITQSTSDHKEALAALLEKREPHFEDR